jgi:hypothetical protein
MLALQQSQPDSQLTAINLLADLLEALERACDEFMQDGHEPAERDDANSAEAILADLAAVHQMVDRLTAHELAIAAKLGQARHWAAAVANGDVRLKTIAGMFHAGTNALADQLPKQIDPSQEIFNNGGQVLPFLMSRGIISDARATCDGTVPIVIDETYMLSGVAPLGALVDLVSATLNALDAHYPIYELDESQLIQTVAPVASATAIVLPLPHGAAASAVADSALADDDGAAIIDLFDPVTEKLREAVSVVAEAAAETALPASIARAADEAAPDLGVEPELTATATVVAEPETATPADHARHFGLSLDEAPLPGTDGIAARIETEGADAPVLVDAEAIATSKEPLADVVAEQTATVSAEIGPVAAAKNIATPQPVADMEATVAVEAPAEAISAAAADVPDATAQLSTVSVTAATPAGDSEEPAISGEASAAQVAFVPEATPEDAEEQTASAAAMAAETAGSPDATAETPDAERVVSEPAALEVAIAAPASATPPVLVAEAPVITLQTDATQPLAAEHSLQARLAAIKAGRGESAANTTGTAA